MFIFKISLLVLVVCILTFLTFCRYHEWMKSVELRTLTASEPLTLEEEYEMQKTWREDEDSVFYSYIIL